jgi:3-hydroxyacyl-CoA dehydrogenase/enoyl-CoA hydratase/3-hydroxybutyryl-CoA epimerase
MMGAGIAYVSAQAGMEVVLLDTSLEAAAKGKDYSSRLLAKGMQRGKVTQEQADALLARIKPTVGYADLAGCDLVVEAVFEQRDIKADVTTRAEAVVGKGTVFASNTSTLPITGLAQASKRPAMFVGIHFFSPVDKMPLVEIIVGKKTSKEALARALDYVGQLKKTPIVVNDSRGFYTSRVIGTITNEGMAMLAEGIEPALIENAARMAGFPVGPLAVSDEVTLELQWKITRQTEQDLGARFVKSVGYEVLEKMVGLGRLGRRQGGGFYDYPAGGPKQLWGGLKQHWKVGAEQPPVEEVMKRFLFIEALESARCFEEGVISHPADADLGSILGIGYPAWTGGALSYIETFGVPEFVAECQRLSRRFGPRFKPTRSLKKMAAAGQRFYPLPAADSAA